MKWRVTHWPALGKQPGGALKTFQGVELEPAGDLISIGGWSSKVANTAQNTLGKCLLREPIIFKACGLIAH